MINDLNWSFRLTSLTKNGEELIANQNIFLIEVLV